MKAAAGLFLLAATAAQAQKPSSWLNEELPHWLQFSGEYRARVEGFEGGSFKTDTSDAYVLSRLRLNASIEPAAWFRIRGQTQDARVFGNDRVAAAPPYQNTFDLRLAYAEVGRSEGVFQLRAGRQELDFGEQRLLGSLPWTNTARSFDAIRATFHKRGYRLDAFAASMVVAQDGSPDHHLQGSNLHGLYGGFEKLIPKAVVEPYVFWRVASRQKLDTKTGGIRWVGKLPGKFDYGTEMALQRGDVAAIRVSAWAGHWVVGRTFSSAWQARAFVEYNYASGDRDPRDNRTQTFDQLYPTGHDKLGLADQVGWRNIRDVRVGVEAKPLKPLKASLVAHSWHLANASDALYNAAGAAIARSADASAGTHVGEELDAQGMWSVSKQIQLGAGVGHIFPGEFLKRSTPGKAYTFPYLLAAWSF